MFGAPVAQRLCAAPVGLEHGHRTGALTSSVVVVPANPDGQILEGIWKWWSSGGRSKGSISVSFKGRKSPYLGSSLTRGLAGGSTCSERSDCCWRKQQPACRGVGSAERPPKRCPSDSLSIPSAIASPHAQRIVGRGAEWAGGLCTEARGSDWGSPRGIGEALGTACRD